MKLFSPPQDVHARLNLPHPLGTAPRIPAPKWGERGEHRHNVRLASRRALLTALGGGLSGPLSEPEGPEKARRQDPLLTLIHRISQGFNLDEYERAKSMGYEAYLEEQLDHLSIDDSAADARLANWTTLDLSPKELYETYNEDFGVPFVEFKEALLARGVHSQRQLFERMCEFWHDHFNIDHSKGDLMWALLPEHDRTVIRPHALGKFPELLSASAFSAAMLYYLDNWLNVAGAPQENYGRELMELHTLSVFGGYTEADVKEVSKCFTGWTLNNNPNSVDYLRGKFEPLLHTWGQKFALGHVIPGTPPAGQPGQPRQSRDAQIVLDILAAHPSTANFIARKLVHKFLTPTPPESFVEEVAQTYLSTGGDIKSMLRVILARENLKWNSPLLGKKFRRPFHLMMSIYRGFSGVVVPPNEFIPNETLEVLGGMGQLPFGFAPPTGYPDRVEDWGSFLLPRWQFCNRAVRFSGGFSGARIASGGVIWNRIEFFESEDRPGLARRINERLLGERLPPGEEAILQRFIDEYPVQDEHPFVFDKYIGLYDALSLAVSLPGYQYI